MSIEDSWELIDYIGPALAVVCLVMTPIAERITRRRKRAPDPPDPPDPLVVLLAAVHRQHVRQRH